MQQSVSVSSEVNRPEDDFSKATNIPRVMLSLVGMPTWLSQNKGSIDLLGTRNALSNGHN